MRTKILLIEDDPGDVRLIREALTRQEADPFVVEHAVRLADGLRRLETPDIDLVLLDMGLPDSQGLDTLTGLRRREPRVPVIVLTGNEDAELAARTVQAGAQDFLVKGHQDGGALGRSIRHAIERKQAEAALQESEAKYRSLIETTGTGYLILDAHGKVLDANREYARLAGHGDTRGILGRCVTEWTAEHDKPRNAEAVARCARDGLIRNFEVDYVDGNGRITPVEINATVSGAGESLRIISLCRDITERRRAEKALLESEDRYRRLFEASTDGILVSDSETKAFSHVNPAICRMLGYTAEEMRALRVTDIHPESALPSILAGFESVGRGEQPGPVTIPCLRKDGTIIHAEISSIRISLAGRRHNVAVFRDMTERRKAEDERARLEEQLRQAAKMEAVGHLAGGVAHDFNNILTVILGYAETLLRAAKDGDPQQKPVEEIRLAAKRAAGLTRQLLAFSRRQILEPRVLDIGDVLRNLEPMLRRLIGEDIDLRIALPEGLGRVKADPGQVEQVLMNLAVNARDAMVGGGKLTIEAANVTLDESCVSRVTEFKPGPHVMLAVTDTGAGMPPEVQQRLFEPFFTTKERGKGTGLGLSTVYGIIKQSGGHVTVYSEVGRGTTIKILFPRVAAAVEPISCTRMPVVTTRGTETILVAEDEEGVRELVRMMLQESGYTVLVAPDGAKALQIVERHAGPLYLVLCDLVMPQMGGKQLAMHLQKLRPGLKVLFTSGYTDDAICHQGVLDPGIAFIQKPYDLNSLLAKVREVLDAPTR